MTELVIAQAALLCPELDEQGQALLKVLSAASCASLEARLKEGITVLDCQEAFLAAASLLTVAGLCQAGNGQIGGIREFKAGDLTVKEGQEGDGPALALKAQAEALMGPYLLDGFVFLGV